MKELKIVCELREHDKRCKSKYCPYRLVVMTQVDGESLKANWSRCRRVEPTKTKRYKAGEHSFKMEIPLFACAHVKGTEDVNE